MIKKSECLRRGVREGTERGNVLTGLSGKATETISLWTFGMIGLTIQMEIMLRSRRDIR